MPPTPRSCEQCGRSLDGRSARAKFCSSTCRARRAEGAPSAPSVDAPPSVESASVGAQAQAVHAALVTAGRDAHPLGVAAMQLAARVDAGAQETGAAFAALVRELRATLADALKDATSAGDGVDELRAMRERKVTRARG